MRLSTRLRSPRSSVKLRPWCQTSHSSRYVSFYWVRFWTKYRNATSFLYVSSFQAKKFVESLPQVLKEGLSKEDAEKLKKTFTDLGATVALE